MNYIELKDFAKQHRFHMHDMEMEVSLNGESQWYSVTILFSLSCGDFYIVAGYARNGDQYIYMYPQFFEPLRDAIQRDAIGEVDVLEEERKRWREAYIDQRKSA